MLHSACFTFYYLSINIIIYVETIHFVRCFKIYKTPFKLTYNLSGTLVSPILQFVQHNKTFTFAGSKSLYKILGYLF